MSFSTKLQREIAHALTFLAPGIPFLDAEIVRKHAAAKHLREFSPKVSVWLALIAYIRHAHTDYDELMDEGYGKESSRHFALEQTNDKLTEWRATRFLDQEGNGED